MAIIKPFKGIRPTRDKAALATSRSYDEYTEKELKSVLHYNPFSFLHIIRPGYSSGQELSGKERFHEIRASYQRFKDAGIYQQDSQPMYYLHEKSYGGDTFWGIIAIAHIVDYQQGIIKKHEDTLKAREQHFGEYLDITGFNAEPVLLTYPSNDSINRLYQQYRQQRAEYEFTTHTKRLHKYWLIEDALDCYNIEQTFAAMEALYIADGHHRTASSNYLANKRKAANKAHTGTESYNYFMSYLISDSTLKISAFNRFVKDLNGLSPAAFIERVAAHYRVEKIGKKEWKPQQKHAFSMYLDGHHYALYLRKKQRPENHALSALDTHILHQTILSPILGITDLQSDARIKCLPAIEKHGKLQALAEAGGYAVGFGLFPPTIDQLKAVVNEELRMPPKSTYIEPKLRSGLTIYEIAE